MDNLDAKQQAELKKCSDERLRARLMKAGHEEDLVFAWERTKLLEAAAEAMLAGAVGGLQGKPASVWERELVLREQELELRKQEEKR
jgi:hypothetical protein